MSTFSKRDLRALAETPCQSDDALHAWVRLFCGIRVPRNSICARHDAPFDYLRLAYFEPAHDLVVWAPRGGGKTRLGAVATLLDLLHKPGCAVRILGGSMEQSLRMWEHLLPDLERAAPHLLTRHKAARRTVLKGGGTAAVLPQSQRAVRGLRVQKLRCDEIELFDPRVWDAAQLVTRSLATDALLPRRAKAGENAVRATVEALSTLHNPWGLMSRVIEGATDRGGRIVRWCVLDVLQRCPPERDCETCPLWSDCGGVAKTRCDGFMSIDDAIAMKGRVSLETWESEMLCRRPSVKGRVFPHFDPAIHVREQAPVPASSADVARLTLAIDFGFANPFVCLWVRDDGIVHVIDEYVQEGRVIDEHADHIESRPWGRAERIACDPAGAGRNEQTARSNVQLLRARGYGVRYRASRIVDGVEMIRAALRPAAGHPALFVHPRCVRLVRALQAYHYSPDGGELPVKDGVHDHLIDALRYFFVNRGAERLAGRRY